MSSQEDKTVEPRTIHFDSEPLKTFFKRKHPKNAQSQLIPRKTELKIITLNEQVISSCNNTINNTDFVDDNGVSSKKHQKRTSKKLTFTEQRKSIATQKQSMRTRYQDLVKDNMESFKETIQIGPCARSIIADSQLSDMYIRRKIINIEKMTFPLKKQVHGKNSKFRTLVNRTSRAHSKQDESLQQECKVKTMLQTGQRASFSRPTKRSTITQSIFGSFDCRHDVKPEYKKEVSTLFPIRKPSSKKDYFVFGLSEKNNNIDNKIQLYRDLLWKVNYSNGLYVCTPDFLQNAYKFYVGDGNNCNLIRGIMKRRWWWSQATSKNQQGINFLWTQLKQNNFFKTQDKGILSEYFVIERIKSEYPNNECKGKLQQDANKRIFGRLDYKIWRKHLEKNQRTQKKISENTYQKRIKMYEKKRITKLDDSQNSRIHNHLESNFYIGNKKALFYNVKRYMELKGRDPFDFMPLTFHIKKGIQDIEYSRFLSYYEKIEEMRIQNRNVRNIWIVKPGQNTNRGNGITVCYGLDDIKMRLRGRQRNGDGKLRTFILQKYIQNPLLYNKRKFDIRHFVLVTCINGSFKAYWFEEGYIRTSSAQFNVKSNKDPLIHLTNDAIQKNTADYGKYQKGNKLSYAEFQKYLDSSFSGKKYDFFQGVLPQMKEITTEVIKSTYFLLDNGRRRNNFELLGLDFMIDEEFKPWLIEVNTNPCLEMCCPLLHKIIPSLIENTCKLCIDPLFPPPQNWPNNRKIFFGEDPVLQNRYEIIFDENSEGKQIEKIFAGKQKIDSMIGKIEEDCETFQNDGQIEWQTQ